MEEKTSSKKLLFNIIKVVLVVVLLGVVGVAVYISQYYETEEQAKEVMGVSANVYVTKADDMIIYTPANITPREGIIFYPGNKIEYTAYAPMLKMMASQGFACILLEMPYNLPILDKDAANKAMDKLEFVSDWYIGGHGSGGRIAAEFAYENTDLVKGVFLLGAYSTNNLSDSGLKVISLYGTEDKVMNIKKYNKYKDMLPDDFTEVIIEGGNFGSFGYYGDHKNDGTASITKYQQQAYSAINILGLITGQEITTTLEDIAAYENKTE
jgi:hypothetical protein